MVVSKKLHRNCHKHEWGGFCLPQTRICIFVTFVADVAHCEGRNFGGFSHGVQNKSTISRGKFLASKLRLLPNETLHLYGVQLCKGHSIRHF